MSHKPIVCIVDDDESVRSAVGTLLRSVGFDSRNFASGADFLRDGIAQPISCLILDLRMKPMSGLDLQRKLNEMGSKVPVIFISAHGDDDARRRALTAGSLAFFSKPFDERALLECVRQAVGAQP